MAFTDIDSADYSNMTNAVSDYSVKSESTDGATGTEVSYVCSKWNEWFGYYKNIPELNMAIDAIATWTVGKGYKADIPTMTRLNYMMGWGKDTFNTILENMIRTYHICGDAFCEIITDDEGRIINLKPLDPSSIKIVANDKGMIIRYEQINKLKKSENKKFGIQAIFHLARNRVADEIHGTGIVDKLQNIILMRNEAMKDLKTVFHRYVKPINVFHLDTDDTGEVAAFKAKADSAVDKGENLFIPKGAVELDRVSIPQFSTLNPLPWIEALNQYFWQSAGVPDIIVGSSRNLTEASSKIAYLAFQQRVEEEQLFLEEQIKEQLGYEIELEFPASLENELLSDKAKDGAVNVQPNETTAGGVK